MKYRNAIFLALLTAFIVAVPAPAFAANATFFGPIVPQECHCDTSFIEGTNVQVASAPDYGCVLQVIQNVINFAVSMSLILFVIYLTIGGLNMILSGGSSEAISRAKTRLLNVFIGLAVLLCSWLIVDFVMKTVYDEGKFGPWNAILAGNGDVRGMCIIAKNPSSIVSGTVGINAAPGESGGPASGGPTGATGGGSTLNTQAAISKLTQSANPQSTGYCARAVCAAVTAGGVRMNCANAAQLGTNLTSAGFKAVYAGSYSDASQTAFAYQAGDVVVFQPAPNHPNGHTAMYTGSTWISDYSQSRMDPGDKSGGRPYIGASFTIYRP